MSDISYDAFSTPVQPQQPQPVPEQAAGDWDDFSTPVQPQQQAAPAEPVAESNPYDSFSAPVSPEPASVKQQALDTTALTPTDAQEQEGKPGAFNSVTRGYGALEVGFGLGRDLLGMESDPEQTIDRIIAGRKTIESAPPPRELLELRNRFEEMGNWEYAQELVTNPSLALSLIGESLPGMGLSVAGGAVGAIGGTALAGPGGGLRGGLAGMGVGSGLAEFGSHMSNKLLEYGVDFTKDGDELREQIRNALKNPQFREEALREASTRAAIIGAIDALTGKAASTVARRFATVPGATMRDKVVGGVAGLGTEMVGAGVGEAAAGGIAQGELDFKEIFTESFLEGVVGGPTLAMTTALEARYRKGKEVVDTPTLEEMQKSVEVLSAEENKPTSVKEIEELEANIRFADPNEEVDYDIDESETVFNFSEEGALQVVNPDRGVEAIANPLPKPMQDPRTPEGAVSPRILNFEKNKKEVGVRIFKTVNAVAKKIGMPQVKVIIHESTPPGIPSSLAGWVIGGGKGPIVPGSNKTHPGYGRDLNVVLDNMLSPEHVWSVAMHELGHLIHHNHVKKNNSFMQMAVDAYTEWHMRQNPTDLLGKVVARRNSFAKATLHDPNFYKRTLEYLASHDPQFHKYWMGFKEFFAEQVARYATTDAKPLTPLDKLFSALAKDLTQASQEFLINIPPEYIPYEGATVEAEPGIQDILNQIFASINPPGRDVLAEINAKTMRENATYLGSNATPQTTLTRSMRDIGHVMFTQHGIALPEGFKKAMAQVDRFGWFSKWMMALQHVAKRNLGIAPLQRYAELVKQFNLYRNTIIDDATQTLHKWNALSVKQSELLSQYIDWYMNMDYRSAQQKQRGVVRLPTAQEQVDKINSLGMGNSTFAVFGEMKKNFNKMLDRYKAILYQQARKITDPSVQAARLEQIDKMILNFYQTPYFPAMRFGSFTISIRNDQNEVVEFITAETRRDQQRINKQMQKDYPETQGYTVRLSKLDDEQKMLFGLPPGLLDSIENKLSLSDSQREILSDLRFEYSPSRSFRHRLRRKKLVPGYSHDFKRAFSSYFFHGANFFSKAKFQDDMQATIEAVKESNPDAYDATKRKEIAAFMEDHYNELMNPTLAHMWPRAFVFMWALGFSAAAASLNLTQNVLTTAPYLASIFGDVKAGAEMLRVMRGLQTYYTQGRIDASSDMEMKAIALAIKNGTITEQAGPELAGTAEARNAESFAGRNTAIGRGLRLFQEAGSWLFRLSEQFNRRVAFRAAYRLTLDNPNNDKLHAILVERELEYKQLIEEGWPVDHARAFVVATHTVDTTQYNYIASARPRVMRGEMANLLVFKTFLLNTLYFIWNNPSAGGRTLLALAFMGGAMGMPGMEDLKEIIRAVGYRAFGKDYDVEKEARKLIIHLTESEEVADLAMHGVSRTGWGMPALMDTMGAHVGLDIPAPELDRSAAVSMGRVLPMNPAALFTPNADRDPNRAIADNVQQAAGAAYGVGFNLYKFLTDTQLGWDDPKRWERAMPRALRGASKAYRAYTDEKLTARDGSTIVKFNPQDTEHMMEIIAMAGGYNTRRESLQWDRIIAASEAIAYWDMRRTALLRQLDQRISLEDDYGRQSVIKDIQNFNRMLPKFAKGKRITRETIKMSLANKRRSRAFKEAGSDPIKSNRPIRAYINSLYPNAVEVKKPSKPDE